MTGVWTVVVLACINAAILGTVIRSATRRGYRPRPAWLDMDRIDEAAIIAEVDQGLAAFRDHLEQEAR